MWTTFFATVSPMTVMFLCILAGFVLQKTGVCPPGTGQTLSKLETYCLTPALSFHSLATYCRPQTLLPRLPQMGYCVLIMGVGLLIAYALAGFFSKHPYPKNVYRYALVFANYGYMGNAVVEALFGPVALFEYLLITLPAAVVIYLWAMPQLIPKEKRQSPWKALLNAPMIACLAGIGLGVTGWVNYLPKELLSAAGNLGSCMGPIAMVLTGFIVAQYRPLRLVRDVKVLSVSLMRLLVLPALLTGLVILLGADKGTVVCCLIFTAMPLGLNTVVFPAAYGGDPSTGAAMALVSSTLCVVTFPLLLSLVNALGYTMG